MVAAQVLEDNKQAYGQMMTLEMGKTLGSAIAEVEKMRLGLPVLCRQRRLLPGGCTSNHRRQP